VADSDLVQGLAKQGASWWESNFSKPGRPGMRKKNSGWRIVLISFVTVLHQGRKVSTKGVITLKNNIKFIS